MRSADLPKPWYAAVEINDSDRHVLYVGRSRKEARHAARVAWECGAKRCDLVYGSPGNGCYEPPVGPLDKPYNEAKIGKTASEGSTANGYTRWVVAEVWTRQAVKP